MVNILWVLLFKNIYPCALIRPCALIIFQTFPHPVRLLGPVRLLFLKIFPPCALIKPCSSIRHTRVIFSKYFESVTSVCLNVCLRKLDGWSNQLKMKTEKRHQIFINSPKMQIKTAKFSSAYVIIIN